MTCLGPLQKLLQGVGDDVAEVLAVVEHNMRAEGVHKELVVEVVEVRSGRVGYLVAEGVGELIAHPHAQHAVEDVGLGCLVGVGSGEGKDACDALAGLKNAARIATLDKP